MLEKAKEINAEIDAKADAVVDEAKKSPYTMWIFLGGAIVVVSVLSFIF